ncbi:hypothetical protein POM88_016448 [Heracleum sosnowskyi]|uniref:H15 domain-containing protein n=1 Tax=Heracleum sosnowskyi TaxID=360622 RepID=A0AAD8IQL8_9APIA|nr:hypothetical protein POM88_016448 [Heracleum sosnowskyi]
MVIVFISPRISCNINLSVNLEGSTPSKTNRFRNVFTPECLLRAQSNTNFEPKEVLTAQDVERLTRRIITLGDLIIEEENTPEEVIVCICWFLFTDMESHSDLPPATGPDALITKDTVNNSAQFNYLPYDLMLRAAIAAMKERGGSSRQAISNI